MYFFYDEEGHLLGEYGAGGALIQETVWMGNTPVATLRARVGGGVDVYYIHTDHLDTPRKVSRPRDNALMWRWCHRSAYWSQSMIGMSEPARDRHKGATA